MRSIRATVLAFAACAAATFAQPDSSTQRCLRFISPAPGVILNTPACTISIDACSLLSVKSLQITATYPALDRQTVIVQMLGNISRPPYKLVWHLEDMTNQLYNGIALTAEATLAGGQLARISEEGIFLAHAPIQNASYEADFALQRSNKMHRTFIAMASPNLTATAKASVAWNNKSIFFTVQVKDPFFKSPSAADTPAPAVEIGIDPARMRKPFPSPEVVMISVPAFGKPMRYTYANTVSAGSKLLIVKDTMECGFPSSCRTTDLDGFTVDIDVPMTVFGKTVPPEITANIMVRTLDGQGQPKAISWAPGLGDEVYCPLAWGTITLRPRAIMRHPVLLWILAFAIGLAVCLIIGSLIISKGPDRFLSKFQQSEEERTWLETITRAIESRVTDRNLALFSLAEVLSLRPNTINSILRKYAGKDFRDYIMQARVEIAKERLRSSRSSEMFISDSSGFKDANQMEKWFKKICHLTPYEFRQKYHIT
jgi:AraC-like DNA-binding protein